MESSASVPLCCFASFLPRLQCLQHLPTNKSKDRMPVVVVTYCPGIVLAQGIQQRKYHQQLVLSNAVSKQYHVLGFVESTIAFKAWAAFWYPLPCYICVCSKKTYMLLAFIPTYKYMGADSRCQFPLPPNNSHFTSDAKPPPYLSKVCCKHRETARKEIKHCQDKNTSSAAHWWLTIYHFEDMTAKCLKYWTSVTRLWQGCLYPKSIWWL